VIHHYRERPFTWERYKRTVFSTMWNTLIAEGF
jgi:hypothetical protein